MNCAHFDGMVWPLVDDELEWRLRHTDSVTSSDAMAAASVVAAYRELIYCTARKRASVIRNLRAADKSKGAGK